MNRRPDVVLLDYGSGNVRSAQRALERAGADVQLTDDHQLASRAAGLVVPGVGAFGACMTALQAVGAREIIDSRMAHGRPVLGICVGMQVLFDQGVEHDLVTNGLGLLPGVVERLQAPILPHIGWNTVAAPKSTQLFAGIDTERFYFVHSYAARSWPLNLSNDCDRSDVTWSEHGERFVAAVESDVLTATQFHPEKSGDAGLALLRNWLATL